MQPLGWLQAKTGNISVFYLLDAAAAWFCACPPEVRRENKQQNRINSLLRFEDECTAALFHFLPLKQRKQSSEHCCITADNRTIRTINHKLHCVCTARIKSLNPSISLNSKVKCFVCLCVPWPIHFTKSKIQTNKQKKKPKKKTIWETFNPACHISNKNVWLKGTEDQKHADWQWHSTQLCFGQFLCT